MFRRRRFRRFRARRRFRGARRHIRSSYIEIPYTAIVEATTDTFSLLTGADAVTNNISNDSSVADCEKGSRIIGGNVTCELVVDEVGDPPRSVGWALYKDAFFGGMADITDISEVYSPSTSQQLYAQKKNCVAKGKFLFTADRDKKTLRFGSRILRKLGVLREGETVKLFIQNETATASRQIACIIQGHIKTIS